MLKQAVPIARFALLVALCCVTTAQARAGLVLGGSDLLSPAYANQLESWLGHGPLTVTNIFDYKADGTAFDLATAFHSAVDGKGATFTVMRVGDTVDLTSGFKEYDTNQIIGGYNPQSWDGSLASFTLTPDDADRTAFLFNLTTGEKLNQKLSTDANAYAGVYQTLNYSPVGPAFGGGADLYVAGIQTGSNLDNYAYNYTYGPAIGIPNFDGNVLRFDQGYSNFSITDLEVFTIAPGLAARSLDIAAVPEPGTWLMACCSVLGFGCAARRRGRTSSRCVDRRSLTQSR